MSFFKQTFALTATGLRGINQRRGSSLVTIVGVTTVVAVLVALLAMSEGASAFMVKPVQEDQLIASVAQMIGHALPHLAANTAAVGAEAQV